MPQSRPDITENLVHFIRGADLGEAFDTLNRILDERQLRCGTGYIKGDHCCICFSEAPFLYLGDALARGYRSERPYQPFGVLLPKCWVFAAGGRPVIYQPDDEYELLPESHRWRHVRYNPAIDPPIDFTWEREWRILRSEIELDPSIAEVVVPTSEFLERLLSTHESVEDHRQEAYATIIGELTAWQLREDFPWQVRVLHRDGSATAWSPPSVRVRRS